MSFTYYGTQEKLQTKEAFHFKKYCKQTSFHVFNNVFIDLTAISTAVNLDCQHCRMVHPSTCCEDGQPYSMTKNAEQRLMEHAPAIMATYLSSDKQKHAQQHGYLEQLGSEKNVTTIKKCQQGNCFFLGQANGELFCTIHRYAEEKDIAPLEIKPFSCSLFPLDLIQDGEKLYLTAITQQTKKFSRWGSEYQDYLCVNKYLRAELDPDLSYFNLKGYRPAWEWNRELLAFHFGAELITELEQLGTNR